MRGLLVFVLLALTVGCGYIYYENSQKLQDAQTATDQRFDNVAEALGRIDKDYASGQKVNSALNTIGASLQAIRNDMAQMRGEYAVAARVDRFLNEIRNQIDALQKGLAEAQKPPPYTVELGFRDGPDTTTVLRYAGSSVQEALSTGTSTNPGKTLSGAIKVSARDPKAGTAVFNYAVLRSPEGTRTVALGGAKPPALGLVRSTSEATDWDLSPEGRKEALSLLKP